MQSQLISKLGLKITFQVSATNTETWEFFNGTIGNITNVAYWRKTANDADLVQLAVKSKYPYEEWIFVLCISIKCWD